MESLNSGLKLPKRPAIYIRLSEDEYCRLASEAKTMGASMPELLKGRYFSGAILQPLVSVDDQHSILTSLSRISNNVNQIARQFNSGIRAGFNSELASIQHSLVVLRNFFSSKYCRCSLLQEK